MLIGMIAPPWLPVPPPAYGGTESVVDVLARTLAALGHQVRLFTVGDSTCAVERLWLYPHAVEVIGSPVAEAAHVLAAYEALRDCDVIHDHTIVGPLLAHGPAAGTPVVVTHHGPFDERNRRVFVDIARRAAIVAISHSQARLAGDVEITTVIHHGIDLDLYRQGAGDAGHLVFVGRMSPTKGVEQAVRIATEAGRRLILLTKIREAAEREYFEGAVRPLLTPDVEVLVEPPWRAKLAAMRGAVGMVNPIRWNEPFGLVMAESLACGTPVLTHPRGAAPEIVDHGSTGFLYEEVPDLVSAVRRLPSLDRAACRSAAEHRFSAERMARDYVRLYESLQREASGRVRSRTR